MCEEKPGPRCSSDTLKTLRKTAAAYSEQEKVTTKVFKEWLQVSENSQNEPGGFNHGGYMNDGSSDYQWDSYQIERENLDRLDEEVKLANKVYDSTPEGLKSVERLLSVSGNAVTTRTVLNTNFSSPSNINASEKDTTVRIPVRIFLKNRLAIAKEQRDWQTKTLAGLKKAEEVSPAKALFVAQELNRNLVKEKKDLDSKNSANDTDYAENVYHLIRKTKPEDTLKANIAKILVEQDAIESRIGYIDMRLDDLKSYERKMELKSKKEVKKLSSSVLA